MSAVVQIADRAGLLANWPLLADSTYSAPLPHTCHCVFWMAGLETEPYPALPGQLLPLPRLERKTFKWPLHSESCRRGNSTYSARADGGELVLQRLI